VFVTILAAFGRVRGVELLLYWLSGWVARGEQQADAWLDAFLQAVMWSARLGRQGVAHGVLVLHPV